MACAKCGKELGFISYAMPIYYKNPPHHCDIVENIIYFCSKECLKAYKEANCAVKVQEVVRE